MERQYFVSIFCQYLAFHQHFRTMPNIGHLTVLLFIISPQQLALLQFIVATYGIDAGMWYIQFLINQWPQWP